MPQAAPAHPEQDRATVAVQAAQIAQDVILEVIGVVPAHLQHNVLSMACAAIIAFLVKDGIGPDVFDRVTADAKALVEEQAAQAKPGAQVPQGGRSPAARC